jgi:hypothetical protein
MRSGKTVPSVAWKTSWRASSRSQRPNLPQQLFGSFVERPGPVRVALRTTEIAARPVHEADTAPCSSERETAARLPCRAIRHTQGGTSPSSVCHGDACGRGPLRGWATRDPVHAQEDRRRHGANKGWRWHVNRHVEGRRFLRSGGPTCLMPGTQMRRAVGETGRQADRQAVPSASHLLVRAHVRHRRTAVESRFPPQWGSGTQGRPSVTAEQP